MQSVKNNIHQGEMPGINLSKQEKQRTVYWNTRDTFVDLRMEWRASMMRHLFHILPGQRILEIGAGNGKFAQALVKVTRNECKITMAVFSREYEKEIREKILNDNIEVIFLDSFPGVLAGEKFDYIIANHLLAYKFRDLFLSSVKSLLRPGGGLLLFEPNPWNPYLRLRRPLQKILPFLRSADDSEPLSLDRLQVFSILSELGYIQINALPHDFLYPPVPKFLLWPVKNLSIVMENFPYLRNFAGSLYIWARNPALEGYKEPSVDLCEHKAFLSRVSFVIPCHNEEMNIIPLVEGLNNFYGRYIHEIIIVDDNSTDNTAGIAERISEKYNYMRIIRRFPPSGVGRALREGIQMASGEYIVTMDGDFKHIIPEIRDLFDAVAAGADMAVGSRFSPKSVLINYAFTKIIANRAFHLLANLFFNKRFRDVSNNLKIFRQEVAKRLVIESDDFSVNAEIGLKPILLGYKVVEVPISWINRTINMGFSTFRIFKTAPNYNKILFKLLWRRITRRPYQKELK
jgi:SAM-dependent methyltransferase